MAFFDSFSSRFSKAELDKNDLTEMLRSVGKEGCEINQTLKVSEKIVIFVVVLEASIIKSAELGVGTSYGFCYFDLNVRGI